MPPFILNTGDETPDAEPLAFIQGLLADSDATVQFLGQSLYSLWTDLPPADVNAFLDLDQPIQLSVAGTYATGAFDEGAAEIVDYDEFSEEERVKDLTLDVAAFPEAATLQADEVLGRLTVTPPWVIRVQAGQSTATPSP